MKSSKRSSKVRWFTSTRGKAFSVFVFLLLFLAIPATVLLSQQQQTTQQEAAMPQQQVSIATDKATYQPTDSINVNISNLLTVPVYAADHKINCSVLDLFIQVNGQWQPSNVDACPLESATRMVIIPPGKPYPVTINPPQTGFPAGTYRFALMYSYSPGFPGGPGANGTAYSQPFTIGNVPVSTVTPPASCNACLQQGKSYFCFATIGGGSQCTNDANACKGVGNCYCSFCGAPPTPTPTCISLLPTCPPGSQCPVSNNCSTSTPYPSIIVYPSITPPNCPPVSCPPGAYCPIRTFCPSSTPVPQPTCLPRPSCLDANPACQLPQPPGGWCQPTHQPLSDTGMNTILIFLNRFLRGLLGR